MNELSSTTNKDMKPNQPLLIIILCLVTVAFSSCQKRPPAPKLENDLEQAHLRGKVWALRTFSHAGVDTFISNLVRITYNIDGNELEYVDSSFRATGATAIHVRLLHKYNEVGRVIEDAEWLENKLLHKITYAYAADGYKTEDIVCDPAGEIEGKSVFIYDDYGNEKERDYHNERLVAKRYSEYNKQNNLVKETSYVNDTIQHTSRYIYDAKGNMIEDFTYDKKGMRLRSFSYRYDSARNKIVDSTFLPHAECVGNAFGDLYERNTYKYDSLGNVILKETCFYGVSPYSAIKTQYEYKYKYDAHGNWIEKTVFKSDKYSVMKERVQEDEKRQIEYYK